MRVPTATLVCVIATLHGTAATLVEIEESKAARLMKNKEGLLQSNYHDVENPDTGDVSGENAARLVRNRGPITAKITASGKHNNYGEGNRAAFSLVAWKFAGDNGEVHGLIEETLNDGNSVKIDVDCIQRNGNEAIVGGVVTSDSYPALSKRSLDGRRAYVKVVDGIVDTITAITLDDRPRSHCKNVDGTLFNDIEADELSVNVCSKRDGNWNLCLAKEKSDQAIE